MNKLNFTKRDTIKALLAISAVNALTACAPERLETSEALLSNKTATLSATHIMFLTVLAQTIIPKTDTGGAVEAGVPDVLVSLITKWGDSDYQTYWTRGLKQLADILPKDYATRSKKEQYDALFAYDAKVFSGEVENGFYKDMKSTIVTAYYMSELGASEELQYEAVPGDWKGCVDVDEIGRAWAF